MALSGISDLLKFVQTIATVTKELERAHVEIKELRRDLYALTMAVSKLGSCIENERLRTSLTVDNYGKDIDRMKENVTAKFELLIRALDEKLSKYEDSTSIRTTRRKKKRALKASSSAGIALEPGDSL